MKQVKLNPSIDQLLNEISTTRKSIGHLVSTKQSIVAELIIGLYKKEIKQNKVSL
jgi:hypothetical protein